MARRGARTRVLYRSVGGFGIRLFVGLVGAGIGILTYRLALRLVRDRLVACGLTVAALAGIYTVWSERPLLVGVLFLLVLLWVVEVPESIVGRHPLVVIPVLMWLWANTHGTYELGFAYLGLHLLGRWLDGAPPWVGRERRLLTGAAIAFARGVRQPVRHRAGHVPDRPAVAGATSSRTSSSGSRPTSARRGASPSRSGSSCTSSRSRAGATASRAATSWSTVPMLLLALWATRNVAIAPLIGLPVVARRLRPSTQEKPSELRGTHRGRRDHRARARRASLMGYQASHREDLRLRRPTRSRRCSTCERHDLLGQSPAHDRRRRRLRHPRVLPRSRRSSSTTATTCTRGR